MRKVRWFFALALVGIVMAESYVEAQATSGAKKPPSSPPAASIPQQMQSASAGLTQANARFSTVVQGTAITSTRAATLPANIAVAVRNYVEVAQANEVRARTLLNSSQAHLAVAMVGFNVAANIHLAATMLNSANTAISNAAHANTNANALINKANQPKHRK